MSMSRSAAIARHELRVVRSEPLYYLMMTVMPLVLMAFVKPAFAPALEHQGHLHANGAEQAVPGMTVMFALLLMGNVGFGFLREHGWGTWERLHASWATPAEVIAGKVVVPLGQSALQLLVLFGIGGVLYGLHIHGSVLALAAVAALFSITVVALGLALFAVCKSAMQLNALAAVGALSLAGIGGAITPLSSLPGWAHAIVPAVPSYWAMRGFRSAILDGGGFGDVLLPIVMLAAFAAAFLAVVGVSFRFEQTKTYA